MLGTTPTWVRASHTGSLTLFYQKAMSSIFLLDQIAQTKHLMVHNSVCFDRPSHHHEVSMSSHYHLVFFLHQGCNFSFTELKKTKYLDGHMLVFLFFPQSVHPVYTRNIGNQQIQMFSFCFGDNGCCCWEHDS